MTAGSSFSHTFDTVGTYDYFCMVHPWMQGTIVVEEEEVEVEIEHEQESNILNIGVLELATNDNSIFLNGTNSVIIQKENLNLENDKITISGWIKPDFSENTLQLDAVSKANSFELFVTNQKEPKKHAGFAVYNGETWNTIFTDSIVSERWHHITGIVNMSEFFIFLDGQLEGTGTLDATLGLDEKGRLVPINSTINASDEDIIVGSFDIAVGDSAPVLANHFSGTIFDVRITNGTISNEQIFDLYNDDKDIYQRKDILESQKLSNSTLIGNPTMSTESPKLSASECMELATERGLYDEINKIEDYTFVCQFPFDVIIPMNSNLLWIETLSLETVSYTHLTLPTKA